LFDEVEKYVMFVGYPRSGHTLVGALLDAHPNAVIAHELGALDHIRDGADREDLYRLLIGTSKVFAQEGNEWEGYSYQVPGQWQGRFESLKVIGDKKGGRSTVDLGASPNLLDQLERTVSDELRFIHVIRNPYDNITTMFLKRTVNRSLRRTMKNYFSLCETNAEIKRRVGEDAICELRHEDFTKAPKDHLHSLCGFLGLEPGADYIDACAALVFDSPRKRRHDIEWSEANIALVEDYMSRYDFLQGYTYGG
jgi:hypothetical protein